MKRMTAIILTSTTALMSNAAYADSSGLNDPFFWIGEEAGAPAQTNIEDKKASEPAQSGTMQRGDFPTEAPKATGKTQEADSKSANTLKNPVMDDYPMADSPRDFQGHDGSSILADDGCSYPRQTPSTMDFSSQKRLPTGAHGVSPTDQRRGEMAGDDGVLSAIQDNPCADIMRRGGETPNSAKGALREGDIRRANTLEERNIPTHSVGRYSPEGSGLWYRDPANPFIDASNEWAVRRGETLSQLLTRWGDDAGYTIVYQSDIDYVLQADVVIRGTFAEASGQVIESFADATPPIDAEFFLGNKVIVVRSSNEFDGR